MFPLWVTLGWFLLMGAAAQALLAGRSNRNLLDFLAETFLLGVGTSGLLIFGLMLGGVSMGAPLLLAVAVTALAILWVRGSALLPVYGDRRYPILPSLLLLLPVLALLGRAAVLPLRDYDGRAFWILKGKAIALERGMIGDFFQGMGARNLHSEYPLLLPVDCAVLFRLTGDLDDHVILWLYALIAVAFLVTLRSGVGMLTTPQAGAWSAALVAWLPFFLGGEGAAGSGYSDVPLAAFTAAAFFELSADDSSKLSASSRPFRIGVWLSFLLLTKNEGVVIAAALLLVHVATELRRIRRLPLQVLISWILPLAALALHSYWKTLVPLEYDENYIGLARQLPEKLDMIPQAASSLLAAALEWKAWGIFWMLVPVAPVVTLALGGSRGNVSALALLLLVLAGYTITYAVTNWNLAGLASVSRNRLFMHLLGPAVFLLASAGSKLTEGNSGLSRISRENGD
ncbi:MAG TPA: hypothetical protein VM534_04525 [Thermoanaerobaculia bacterium]|nr:hypothetical protein [Thermoanaerobaculia bacterium]